MPEPLVIVTVREFKRRLLNMEAEQVLEMARRWEQVEMSLLGQMEALAQIMAESGEAVTVAQLLRDARFRSLLMQAQIQLDGYETYAAALIAEKQRAWATMAISDSQNLIRTVYAAGGRAGTSFSLLPVSAIEAMIGLAGDGSPLRDLLEKASGEAAVRMTDALVRAIALGKNPRDTARQMADGLAGGLNRALVIARTEQLRAYRTAEQMQYEQSGVVRGFMRISARDDRVCPACLFMDDGRIYPTAHLFEAHPQDRCSMIPVLVGIRPPAFEYGRAWFERQDAETQRTILGPGRYDAWQEGKFDLADVVKRVENETWGAAFVPKTLAELTEE